MAIGAKDEIDQDLVNKYSTLKVDNPETVKVVDTQAMLKAMQDYSNLQRDMMTMDKKLREICSNVNCKSVKYMRINFIPPHRK